MAETVPWCPDVPFAPDAKVWNEERVLNNRTFAPPSSLPRSRRMGTGRYYKTTVRLVMTKEQLALWWAWFDAETADGGLKTGDNYFIVAHPRTGVEYRWKISSNPTDSQFGLDWALSFEVWRVG